MMGRRRIRLLKGLIMFILWLGLIRLLPIKVHRLLMLPGLLPMPFLFGGSLMLKIQRLLAMVFCQILFVLLLLLSIERLLWSLLEWFLVILITRCGRIVFYLSLESVACCWRSVIFLLIL